ncbi:(Fe-S)-binding protein [Lachnoclostridium phytofermentans]|uniref:Cysteine-rich domain-containing protein n=1 Tax=Lachnoclostridium phytofermentans (strain ATCC 700394 / DSM 18823 / ISDg) TaxID=357809 RepID=A9KM08_LACP7|nr:(Fe-S)-binding protein [Lachnoclostridium phytofermentans]ABX41351.1 hypothetical protein Cphy_0969 [Lachnoclostridium phytofermentans ISDg]
MTKLRLPSISLSQIDIKNCWFNPGCALSIYKPYASEKILSLLNRYWGPVKLHSICCHHDPQLPKGATIINNCAGCDRRFRSLYEGIQTISLWELLDQLPELSLPHYEGLTLSVHDSCSFRSKPRVHAAVRSLLHKMGIEVVESQFNGTNSICCGDNFYNRIPLEEVHKFQKNRAAQMPCQDVAVYCVSCIKSMTIGGKTARYMVDLLLGEETEPQEIDLVKYHDTLQTYIDSH